MALTVLVGFSACFAASEGIRATQSKSRREEHRSRKNNLIVHCSKSSIHTPLLEGRRVVLSGNKLYIDTGTDPDAVFGHPFAGYYLAYPDTKHSGLVSTISDELPLLNWIYVDRDTYEVKFGGRDSSEGHIVGPFDCTRQDRRLTLYGWEGFVAVQEGDFWALYFDLDDDRLAGKWKGMQQGGRVVLEVELFRKEMRQGKPPAPPPPPPPPSEQTETAGPTAGKREQGEGDGDGSDGSDGRDGRDGGEGTSTATESRASRHEQTDGGAEESTWAVPSTDSEQTSGMPEAPDVD